jgi:phospholipid/cholesterol/gamma-HCH transport system substrate-binding protein
MINRRVIANLVIFGLLFVVLSVWAVTNVLSVTAITHPYDITAEFASSPGLRPRFEVAYLGVKVGQISSVTLGPGMAVVKLQIQHGEKLPVGLTAQASRQSPVGEPYVALNPPSGYTGGGPYVRSGYLIPVKSTTVPLSYEDVFRALDRLVGAVPAGAAYTLVHELALGLAGRADALRQVVENTDSLTSTLAANTAQIDQLISDLTQLSQTFADHGGALGSSLDSLTQVASSLAQSRQTIDQLLASAPNFGGQVASILSASDANLGCVVDGLGEVATLLAQPGAQQALAQALGLAPAELAALPHTHQQTPVGESLRAAPLLSAAGPSNVPVYDTQKTLPPVPTVPACPGAPPPPSAAGAVVSGGAGGHASARAGSTTVTTITPHHQAAGLPTSSGKPENTSNPPIALIGLLAAARRRGAAD